MGESKIRRQAAAAIDEAALIGAASLTAQAIQKLLNAASSNFGADCYLTAELGRVLLGDMGFEAKRCVGFAAWRVSDEDGGVVAHTNAVKPANDDGLAYHAWLLVGDYVIDFTTYQLRHKAAELDRLDGGRTTVQWCPDFLLIKRQDTKTYGEVASLSTGLCYYERRPDLENRLSSMFELDSSDVQFARLILSNPNARVLGPRDRAYG